jgi:hypothetical protein
MVSSVRNMVHGIVILGMHRSGTSLTANLVKQWGAYAGPEEELAAADKWNPYGYWENFPLIYLNMDLLNAVGARTYAPPSDSMREHLKHLSLAGSFRDRALKMVSKFSNGVAPWLWKDPRVSILLPFWKNIFAQITYVVVTRHPSEVAASLHRRDPNLPIQIARLIWQRYTLEILRETVGHNSVIFMNHRKLLSMPNQEADRLGRFLCAETGVYGNSDSTLEMVGVIHSELQHHRNIDLEQAAMASQESLYSLMSSPDIRSAVRSYMSSIQLPNDWHEEVWQGAIKLIDFDYQSQIP